MEEELAAASPPGVDETGDTEMHPLENPVVLGRLFELMPFQLEDFKRIRLVSRAWHSVTLSTWRKNAWLILQDSDLGKRSGSGIVEDDDEREIARISRQKYLDLLDKEQLKLVQHPFRKYSLNNWKIGLQSLSQDGEQDQIHFWNRVLPLMTHLDLSESKLAGVEDLRTVIFETTSNLQSLKLKWNVYNDKRPAKKEQRLDLKLPQHARIPAEQVQTNLVELEIYLLIDDDDVPPVLVEAFPITWMELIIHFPNIKKLGLMELRAADLLEFFESAEILRRERGPVYLAHLTDLHLMSADDGLRDYRGTLISSINRLQFSLKRLDIEVDSTVDEETFKQLLQHPLESLTLRRLHDENTMPFQNFPFGLKMSLKELELCACIAPNLAFLRECPNLERFIFCPEYGCGAELTQILIDGSPTKLEKLTDLTFHWYELGTEEIRKLGVLFPNVRNLQLGLNDESFTAVCEIWKELEHLTLHPRRIGEAAFLGKDEQSGEKYHHPNITEFRNLKQLKIYGSRQEFTDAMISDGILALPNLEHVDVSPPCLLSQVSPHVRRQLQSKFPKCEV